jgi:hypothetical protein
VIARLLRALVLHFLSRRVARVTALAPDIVYSASGFNTGGSAMRILIACAIVISSVVGLAGCVGHHEKAVVSEPLKLG